MEYNDKPIDVLVQTPFGSYIKTTATLSGETLHINDDNDLNGRQIHINLALVIKADLASIRADIAEQQKSYPDIYKDCDPDDITLDNVKIKRGDYILCTYTVNVGTYRRICVGILSNVDKDCRQRNHYFAYPPVYSGKVCW